MSYFYHRKRKEVYFIARSRLTLIFSSIDIDSCFNCRSFSFKICFIPDFNAFITNLDASHTCVKAKIAVNFENKNWVKFLKNRN